MKENTTLSDLNYFKTKIVQKQQLISKQKSKGFISTEMPLMI